MANSPEGPEITGSSAAVRLRRLADRQAIQDCILRYAQGIDRGDRALVEDSYHDDAVDDHGFFVGDGPGLFEAAMDRMSDADCNLHHLTTQVIDIGDDVAHAETYHYAVMRSRSGHWVGTSGRYIDRLARRGGRWRIAARTVVVEDIVRLEGSAEPTGRHPAPSGVC